MNHHVVYVPGLGDERTLGQDVLIKIWRLYGLTPHYFALGWKNKEGFAKKESKLVDFIDSLKTDDNKVSLVGVSAGASACINVFSDYHKISRLVCISGKINNPQTINQHYFNENPDFEESIFRVKQSLDSFNSEKLSRIMSTHPKKDQTVPIRDTIIPGTKELQLPGMMHANGIFYAITVGSKPITDFIKYGK